MICTQEGSVLPVAISEVFFLSGTERFDQSLPDVCFSFSFSVFGRNTFVTYVLLTSSKRKHFLLNLQVNGDFKHL